MRKFFATNLCLVLFALVPTSGVDAAVDLEVSLKTSVRGTIAPSGEVERYRFEATEGTLLSFSVSGKTLNLEVLLTDPEDNPVDLTSLPGFRSKGSKVSGKKIPLTSTGTWELAVSGVGTGDYSLKISGKPAKKLADTVSVAASSSTTLSFPVPSGAGVSLLAKAAKGSTAEPRFGAFDGQDLTEQGKFSSKSHKIKIAEVTGGELDLELKNLGASDGEVSIKISIKAPKPRAQKLDVTADSLGNLAPGGTAFGREVEANIGGALGVEDQDSSIVGAGISIPAAALAEDTTITITTTAAVEPPDPGTQQAAGPAVEFGPAGTTFSVPVDITIPYDPSLLSAGVDASTSLRVVQVKQDGSRTTLTPTAVDEVGQTVTVQTSSFSTFMGFGPKGPPNLESKEFWTMFLEIEHEEDSTGNNSLGRSVSGSVGVASFGVRGQEDDSSWTGTDYDLSWTHDEFSESEVSLDSEAASTTLTWDYGVEDRTLRLTDAEDEDIDFALGSAGNVLLAGYQQSNDSPSSSIELLIEKPATSPTLETLAGKYTFGQFYINVSDRVGPVNIETGRSFGSITLKSNGTWSVKTAEHSCEVVGFSGSPDCDVESGSGGSTWRITGPEDGLFEGSVILQQPDDEGEGIFEDRFISSADGNVIMGLDFIDDGEEIEMTMLVAIREGSGLSAEKVAGDFALRGLDVEIAISNNDLFVGDIDTANIRGTVTIESNSTGSALIDERTVESSSEIIGGVLIEEETDRSIDIGRFTIGSNGSLVFDDGDTTGALVPDGGFGFFMDNPSTDIDTVGLLFLLK